MKAVFSGLAVVSSGVSAGLWFWAARGIKVDAADFGAAYGGTPSHAVEGFARQARFNALAAAATGVSAVFQAASMWP
jgi:hypothetical protein